MLHTFSPPYVQHELSGIRNAIALPPCHVNRHDELLLQKTGPVVMIHNLDHGYSQLDS